MKEKLSSSYVQFDVLKNEPEFLNFILNHINSAILLLDSEMKLQAFNEPLTTLFSNRKNENLLYVRCGEALGCAHSVEEKKDCGTTSKCNTCELRENALFSYVSREPVYRKTLEREFYMQNGEKENKLLEYSIKPFRIGQHYFLMTIINDLTFSRLKPSFNTKN